MLRRTIAASHYWMRYRFVGSAPQTNGPPPKDAPQSFNDTKSVPALDPVEDSFPVAIRGGKHFPDVPEDQLVQAWYVGERIGVTGDELRLWTASAPENAYRFRQWDEFDAKGRAFVQKMREFSRVDPEAPVNEKGEFPFREAYLTRINPDAYTPKPSRMTQLDRAINEKFKHTPTVSVLAVQRDVGRLEKPPKCAGAIPVDGTVFPFSWNTDDWYEYENAKLRTRRFHTENLPGESGSEVTYKLVLEGDWDHHVERMAEDVAEFIREVGRAVVEEKLVAVRHSIAGLRSGRPVDPELQAALGDGYSPEEAADLTIRELQVLEHQCLEILSKCASQPEPKARYNSSVAWPHVEHLDPWVRMTEYWGAMGDKHWSHMEMSTQKVEFRKFYRVIIVKMPFVSTDLEKRIYDIRHWAHRGCTIEYQTIFNYNLVHDKATFPVEHDPVTPMSHENHRLFSFALDWQEGPAAMQGLELVRESDSWQSVATRLGTTVEALKTANKDVTFATGASLAVPPGATKAIAANGHGPLMELVQGGKRLFKCWGEIAKALDCEVDDLQDINGESCDENGELLPDVTQINVPLEVVVTAAEQEFAKSEYVLGGDTWELIARRLGTTVEDLRAANPNHSTLPPRGTALVVPPTATIMRRITDPMLLHGASQTVTNRLRAEMAQAKLDSLPQRPPGAEQFPFEFMDSTTRFPFVPKQPEAVEDWLSYTATYLDPDISTKGEAATGYAVNRLWPFHQVPGRVDQTPFEEDQTWFTHHIPLQRQERFHPDGYLQDLPNINNEKYPRSLDWQAP